MMQPELAGGLGQSVAALIRALETLFQDLTVENDALGERCGVDELECIALRKCAAVEHVSKLYDDLRVTIAGAHDGQFDLSNGLAWVSEHNPQLRAQVNRLLDLTKACQLANQRNGAMIGAHLRSTERAIQSLHDLSSNTPDASTYTENGQTRSQQLKGDGVSAIA